MLSNESNESNEFNNGQPTSLGEGEPDWDSQRMNTLAGFEDNTNSAEKAESTSSEDSDSLLPEEDPYSLRTEQSFQNHPLSKLGLVSLSTLALVGVAGAFLSANVMQSQGQKPREQQVNPIAKENQDKTDATDSQGRVLTDLALTTQGKELAALNEKDKQQPPIPEKAAKPSSKPTAPNTSRASARTYARAPRPRPIAAYSPPRPVTAYAPPRTYTPPRTIPKPVVQPSPVVQLRSVEPTAPAEEVNPMERWIAAAQLGSHGQFSASEETTTDETTTPAEIANNQTPVEYAALTVSAKSKQQPPPTPTVNFDEETPILQEQPRQLLVPGTGAKAVLATPFAWDGSEDTPSDLLSVVLAEPLLAADGTVALPAKTQLLVEVRSLSESGLVRLVASAAIVKFDDQQYEVALPENAIGIRGEEGKPLIAQKLNDKGREIRRRDVTRFVIGAAGRAAGLINRPRSESVASNSGSFSRSTTQNDDPDLLAGILEGGSEAILDDIDERNEEALSALVQRPDVLFLKAGTKVEVFVNQSAAVDVLLRDQPILESQQHESEQFALTDSDTFLPDFWEPDGSNSITPVVEERQALAWLEAE